MPKTPGSGSERRLSGVGISPSPKRVQSAKKKEVVSSLLVGFLQYFGTLLLFIVFFLCGFSKLTDSVIPGLHIYWRSLFDEHVVNVWQKLINDTYENFTSKQFPIVLNSDFFRKSIGSIELIGSILLIFGGKIRRDSSIMLFLIMLGAMCTHVCMDESVLFPGILAMMCSLVAATC